MASRTQTEYDRLVNRPAELQALEHAIARRPVVTETEGAVVVDLVPKGDGARVPEATSLGPANKAVATGKTKLCTKCKQFKPIERYPPHKTTKDGFAAYCKDCRAVMRKHRHVTNFEARLKHHFAARMSQQLSGMAELPPLVANMESYVGYKMKDLVQYLHDDLTEREGITLAMAFDRGYHIDHIIALTTFKVKDISDKAFKKCWAMSNLRAISSEDNLRKGSKDVFE